MTVLTAEAVAGYAYGAGFRGEGLVTAVAISHAESGFRTDNTLDNAPLGGHGIDRGLWQINSYWHPEVADACAFDPACAARETYRISSGGSSWSAWTTYNRGQYRQYLDEARAAARTVEARGGTPDSPSGTGGDESTSTSSSSASTFNPSGRPIGPAGADNLPVIAISSTLGHVSIAGGSIGTDGIAGLAVDDVAPLVIGAPVVDLSTDEVSELTLDIADPERILAERLFDAPLNTAAPAIARLLDLSYAVVATEQRDGEGGPILRLTGRPAGILAARTTEARTMSNTSPTQYVYDTARDLGFIPAFVAATAVRPTIAPEPVEGVNPGTAGLRLGVESQYQVWERLAKEEGFWLFEAAGSLYFAAPRDLINYTTTFYVLWDGGDELPPAPPNGPGGHRPASWYLPVGTPESRITTDDEVALALHVRLPRIRGERVRPGMRLVARNAPPGMGGDLIVNRVSWPIDGGYEPVDVYAVSPRDPEPDNAAASGDGAASDPGAPAPGSSGRGPVSAAGWSWPAQGRITGRFGDPRAGHRHAGIDIANAVGTPILAAKAGRVVTAHPTIHATAGRFLELDHGDGSFSRYLHLDSLEATVGAAVTGGQRIGRMGATGHATGPHLHFEIRHGGPGLDGVAIDPLTVLPAQGSASPSSSTGPGSARRVPGGAIAV